MIAVIERGVSQQAGGTTGACGGSWSLRLLFGVLLALVSAVGALSLGGQAAATDGEQTIFGAISYTEEGSNERIFLEGVEITVEGVETVATDADGAFSIPVEPGNYTVSIDPTTLPPGTSLRDLERIELSALVEPGRDQRVLFAVVAGESGLQEIGGGISFRRVSQLIANGLKDGLYLAMAAIGLSLIFGTTGLTNFAHAEMVTWGMLSTYFFNFYGLAGVIGFLAPLPGPFGDGVPVVFSVVLGAISGGVLGWLINRVLFKGARRAGVALLSQMLMTIGLSILMRYVMLYFFRGGPRQYLEYTAQRAITLGPVELTPKDMVAMVLSVVILTGVGLYLQKTKMGKAMRAVSDNRELAESTGIDVERVISNVWVAGAALAATAGAFYGLTTVRWDFGFRILLLMFAAVVLGGLGTAYGAFMGALLVGLSISLSTLFIDAELKNMVALLVLVVVLLFRPQGLFGRPERIG
jgi:neutral amino acid transport system permease protein